MTTAEATSSWRRESLLTRARLPDGLAPAGPALSSGWIRALPGPIEYPTVRRGENDPLFREIARVIQAEPLCFSSPHFSPGMVTVHPERKAAARRAPEGIYRSGVSVFNRESGGRAQFAPFYREIAPEEQRP